MTRISSNRYHEGRLWDGYDYDNQAWARNGKYLDCGHPSNMDCGCFDRIHRGEDTPLIGGSVQDDYSLSTGAERIAAERARQITDEQYTLEHDICFNGPGDMTAAALAYAEFAWWQIDPNCGWSEKMILDIVLEQWFPWSSEYFKPADDPIQNLVKAGALIAAEIDRVLHEIQGKNGFTNRMVENSDYEV